MVLAPVDELAQYLLAVNTSNYNLLALTRGLAVNSSNVVYNQPVMFPAMYHESLCTMMGTQILADYADFSKAFLNWNCAD